MGKVKKFIYIMGCDTPKTWVVKLHFFTFIKVMHSALLLFYLRTFIFKKKIGSLPKLLSSWFW